MEEREEDFLIDLDLSGPTPQAEYEAGFILPKPLLLHNRGKWNVYWGDNTVFPKTGKNILGVLFRCPFLLHR